MIFTNNNGFRMEVEEGDFIESGVTYEDGELLGLRGVVFLSLGLIVNCDSDIPIFEPISSLSGICLKRRATSKEIDEALSYAVETLYSSSYEIFSIMDIEISKQYINTANDTEILPLVTKKFASKEEISSILESLI